MTYIGELGAWFDPLLAGAIEIVGPNDLLGVWPLWGPQLVVNEAYIDSPDDFSNPVVWLRNELTTPDAHTVRETVANATHSMYQRIEGKVSIGTLSWSVDVEPDGRDYLRFRGNTGVGNQYFWANLQTGATYGAIGCTPASEFLGSGRWRFTMTDALCESAALCWMQWYLSPDGATVSYAGDVTKGVKLYNAQIAQTSIVTAPNLYGDQALALFGNRYDLTNATKATQPVDVKTGWNGLECARFTGNNFLYNNALASHFQGEDKPLMWAIAQQALAPSLYLVSLGNSADNNPYEAAFTGATYGQAHGIRDNTGSGLTAPQGTGNMQNRSVILQSMTGQAVDAYFNGVIDIPAANRNVGGLTLDRYTLGAFGRISTLTGFNGRMRLHLLAKRYLSAAESAALSRLMTRYCPV